MATTHVLLHVDEPYQERFAPWLAAGDLLRERGFEIELRRAGGRTTGDLNLVQTTRIRKPDAKARRLLDHHPILYERSDAEPVSPDPALRALIADLRVRAHLKDVLPRDPALHDAPMVERRYHLTFLPDATGRVPPSVPTQPLGTASRAKIRSFLPVYMFPRMDDFVDQPSKPLSRRPIDVAFAGTIEYAHVQVTLHRRAAIAAVRALGRKSRVIEGNRLSRADYRQLLAETKIFVSPYGLGGFSWKDFEAIYMGAVVVKPDCAFALTYGFDVYGPGAHVVSCRPDFADLADVVATILDGLPAHEARAEHSRAAIHAARDFGALAADLADLFRTVRDGSPPASR